MFSLLLAPSSSFPCPPYCWGPLEMCCLGWGKEDVASFLCKGGWGAGLSSVQAGLEWVRGLSSLRPSMTALWKAACRAPDL